MASDLSPSADGASFGNESCLLHEKHKGKIEIKSKVSLRNKRDLALAYTPGVAEPCRRIAKNPDDVYRYTSKGNSVAVVTDGSRVLGLGNIKAKAAMPVMEGKAVLFKEFGGVDAYPVCLGTQDPEEIIDTVKRIAPNYGGINLEDIESPKCFEVEERLKSELDIPVFHDDQHGTAIVALAGLINSLKVVGKKIEDVKVVVNGAGAAGCAITKLLVDAGVKDCTVLDSKGALYKGGRPDDPYKEELASITNYGMEKGSLEEVIGGADVFIGASAPNVLTKKMVKKMAKDPIVFALANPEPEINPDVAYAAGARVVATGRSDYKNQVNNVLAFPGVFRGALDARASEINEYMKVAAAYAIADCVSKPTAGKVVPSPFNRKVAKKVAEAVYKAAVESGVSRL